jgi:hypothetical protein
MKKAGERILAGAEEALAFARGKTKGSFVHVPEEFDVTGARTTIDERGRRRARSKSTRRTGAK